MSADVVGYSDDFLVQTVQNAVNDGLWTVVHRDGPDVEVAYARDDVADAADSLWDTPLFGHPPIDDPGLEASFGQETLRCATLSFDDVRVFRFTAGLGRETAIVIDEAAPLELPQFERTVHGVVTEKWASD